jgi:hypothetical protein
LRQHEQKYFNIGWRLISPQPPKEGRNLGWL